MGIVAALQGIALLEGRLLIEVISWLVTLVTLGVNLWISRFLWKHYSFPSLPWYWIVRLTNLVCRTLVMSLSPGAFNGMGLWGLGGIYVSNLIVAAAALLTWLLLVADCAHVFSVAKPELKLKVFQIAERIRPYTGFIGFGAVVLCFGGWIVYGLVMLAGSSKP